MRFFGLLVAIAGLTLFPIIVEAHQGGQPGHVHVKGHMRGRSWVDPYIRRPPSRSRSTTVKGSTYTGRGSFRTPSKEIGSHYTGRRGFHDPSFDWAFDPLPKIPPSKVFDPRPRIPRSKIFDPFPRTPSTSLLLPLPLPE